MGAGYIKITIVFCLFWIFVASVGASAQMPAIVQPQKQAIIPGESGIVKQIIAGDIFVLENGLEVEIAAIQTPKSKWNNKSGKARKNWPLAEEAKQALEKLVLGKKVQLYYTVPPGKNRNRYGYAAAQITIIDGEQEIWLQQAMLELGMARVYSWPGQKLNIKALYRAEAKARDKKLGIWNSEKTNGFYDIRTPDPNALAQMVDSVQIVEGIILKTAKARGIIYLNFGTDYNTDFTIAIDKGNKRAFARADYDPLLLAGAKVRVRGYIELYGGPIIWLDDPNRLEVLE